MSQRAASLLELDAVETPKNPAAVELGRRGGKKRAENMTAEERSESARRAVTARWEREDHFSDDKARELLKLTLLMQR